MTQLFKSQAHWLLLVLLPACGGSDSSGGAPTTAELVASCKRTCNKMKTCMGDAGGAFINCDQMCAEQNFSRGQGGQSSAPACDYGRMRAKLDECEKVQCSELNACYEAAGQICSETSSGAGGGSSTGTGGSTSGSGGSGTGTGNCAICDEASVCCRSLAAQAGQDPASCDSFSAATCASVPAAQQATFIQGCSGVVGACP